MRIAIALASLALLALGGCASSYAPSSWTGGYSEREVGQDTWMVSFGGNGYTTEETVQTYWLYHCAEFALSKGYDGFRILSPIKLSAVQALRGDGVQVIRVHGGGGGGGGHSSGGRSGGGYVATYGYAGAPVNKPAIDAEIQLLRRPLAPVPGRTFEAAALKALLEPYVTGPKCNGNVCPHVHSYLYPPAS